jgi:hypothetical protein
MPTILFQFFIQSDSGCFIKDATEIGENTGLYMFGFNTLGIIIAYVMVYTLTGFTTFVTILGRYNYSSGQTCSYSTRGL